ncbi:pyrroline-5-carboxylate reductase [Acinetobacter sp. HY1485]|uniref:pyrroline-5-carboxylate reductase n=1 Tax=Acinetobacter sp. HY1485 TaxID=2970918 RepID=UPI0022B9C4B6|nr:pyrroline-5-carboxylate reductase [Acinetobacter sp. HY1485]
MSLACKVCFIGAGNMAQALIGGLIAQGVAPENIIAAAPSEKTRQRLAEQGLQTFADNAEAVEQADVVILSVKPQILPIALASLQGKLDNKLLISVIAGAKVETIAKLAQTARIVRVMPNTPALVQAGAHGLYATDAVNQADRELATQIIEATGMGIWVNAEDQIDAVTAVSGSGPAYFFYMMDSMIRAGKNLGLDEETAKQLTLQTALGAAQMAINSDLSPAELRKNVTSPNGTTQAALEVFDRMHISQNIQVALAAAKKRSQELAQEFSDKTI